MFTGNLSKDINREGRGHRIENKTGLREARIEQKKKKRNNLRARRRKRRGIRSEEF